MKLYQCHKQVHAEQMNRLDYNNLRGWLVPADEHPMDEGYKVLYDKGTDLEYVSWSPKLIFEAGYDEVEVVSITVG